jgi:hypothetical protein
MYESGWLFAVLFPVLKELLNFQCTVLRVNNKIHVPLQQYVVSCECQGQLYISDMGNHQASVSFILAEWRLIKIMKLDPILFSTKALIVDIEMICIKKINNRHIDTAMSISIVTTRCFGVLYIPNYNLSVWLPPGLGVPGAERVLEIPNKNINR